MIQEKLNNLIPKINSFQINSVINIDAEIIKIINEKIYAYMIDNSIKVFDCKTFEELAILKLPFERPKLKSSWEILENEIVIIFFR